MLYDLNIAWSPTTPVSDLECTLRFSQTLGYDVVALNHTITGPLPPPAQLKNPLPRFPNSSSATKKSDVEPNNKPRPPIPTVLHRATLVLGGDGTAYHRLPALSALYDIVAIRPTTERDFAAACTGTGGGGGSDSSGAGDAGSPLLISLDLAQRFPFHFRPRPCMAAVNRGARFEVCYARCLPSSSPSGAADDQRTRATFIGNLVELVRATRGRGIVLSSGARDALGLRAPADVVNLLAVWGLGPERGAQGLDLLPRGLLANERLRRTGFRGVVDIVGVADKGDGGRVAGDDGDAMEVDGTREGVDGRGQGKNQGQKNKQQQKQKQNNGGKRKAGGQDEGGGRGGESGGGGPGGEGGDDKPLSKRQAKKLKKAAASAQRNPGPPPPEATAISTPMGEKVP